MGISYGFKTQIVNDLNQFKIKNITVEYPIERKDINSFLQFVEGMELREGYYWVIFECSKCRSDYPEDDVVHAQAVTKDEYVNNYIKDDEDEYIFIGEGLDG